MISEILLFFALIVLAVSGGFITDASSKIPELSGFDNNSDLKTAYSNSIWAAVICWLSVAITLGLLIFYFAYTPAKLGTLNKIVSFILFLLLLIPVFLVGILSAVTADYINKSGVDKNSSYRNSIIAAILAIVGFVILLITMLFTLTYKAKKVIAKIRQGKYSDIIPEDIQKIGISPDLKQPSNLPIGQQQYTDQRFSEQANNLPIGQQQYTDQRFPEQANNLPIGQQQYTDQRFPEQPRLGGQLSDSQINDWIQQRYNINVPNWLIRRGRNIAEQHVRGYYPEVYLN